jgi:hypothetical protein
MKFQKEEKQVHLLWLLLVLKTYNTQHDLAGRCGVCKDTFKAWQDLFLEQIASLGDKELVSVVLVLLPYLTFLILLPHLLAIRLTLKTDTWMLIQTKSIISWWMGLTFGSMNHCHSTPSGFLIKSMALLSGTKWAFVLKLDGLFGLIVPFQQELGQMLTSLIIASFTFWMLESIMQQMVAMQMDIDLLVMD